MASSAERTLRVSAGAIALTVILSGCVSTQQKAKWNQIANARVLASQSSTLVKHAGGQVRVTRTAVLEDGSRVALAVGLRNTTGRAVNDIPISVGFVDEHGVRSYLNRAANLDYFETHVAEIPAHATETWVFTGRRRHGISGRPFAVAGRASHPPTSVTKQVPVIAATLTGPTQHVSRGPLKVTVTNRSAVPQVDLHVYAVALAGDRLAAAGSATANNLASGDSTTLRLKLVGLPRGAAVQVHALPTLFQ